ncbi:outer membrane protein assembly factor BamB [Massilia sp. W12]|uniref:outer membrane protein assembly factor BamB n=1 Tax=Massilia sp. W12 TaxID=3126507 RepID=UPI0030CEA110
MKKNGLLLALCGVLSLSACSSLNPFADPPRNPPAQLSEFKPSMAVRQVWSYAIGSSGDYAFSPAQAGDSLFVAAADGALARLDVASGKAAWRIQTGQRLTGGVGAASDGNLVVVATEKGGLQAYDGQGKLRWSAQASSEVLSAPAVGGGLVAVRSHDNKITAYDAETGARRWQAQRIAPPLTLRNSGALTIDAGNVYVAMPGGRMLALSGQNGSVRWEVAVAEPRGATELERVTDLAGAPVLAGREICAVTYQGKLACYDRTNGQLRWSKEFSSDAGMSVDERFVFASDEKGSLSAFNREGKSLWRNDKLAWRRLSAPASIGRAVAVADYQGFIHFLSREDGAFLARLPGDGSPTPGMPLVANDRLILQTKNGAVLALAAD